MDIFLAFLLRYITDSALQGSGDRIGRIAFFAVLYPVFATAFDFEVFYSGRKLRVRLSQLLCNAIVGRIQNCSVEEKEKLGNAHYFPPTSAVP